MVPKGARYFNARISKSRAESRRACLEKNSKHPFEYKWGGYILLDVFRYLKEKKRIDLEKNSLVDVAWQEQWIILDKALKDKYFTDLDPARFKESELLFYYVTYYEHQLDLKLKRSVSTYSPEQLKGMMAKSKKYAAFPDAGRAMLDGIVIIYNYLKLIDDKSLVLLTIG